ncbi:MAG: hypothetical protein R2757_21975 [Draconibacterium sp.]
MSTKVKDKYVTYELLPDVVSALKDVALANGCGYCGYVPGHGRTQQHAGWVGMQFRTRPARIMHFSAKERV